MDRFFGVEDPPAGGVPANPVEAESKAAGLVAAEPPMRRRRRRLPHPRSKALAATDADPVEPIGVAPCRAVSKAISSDGPSPSAMPKALDSSNVEVGMDTLLDELVRAALLEVTSAKGASPAPVASSAPGLGLGEASGAGILAKCASTSPAASACDLHA